MYGVVFGKKLSYIQRTRLVFAVSFFPLIIGAMAIFYAVTIGGYLPPNEWHIYYPCLAVGWAVAVFLYDLGWRVWWRVFCINERKADKKKTFHLWGFALLGVGLKGRESSVNGLINGGMYVIAFGLCLGLWSNFCYTPQSRAFPRSGGNPKAECGDDVW